MDEDKKETLIYIQLNVIHCILIFFFLIFSFSFVHLSFYVHCELSEIFRYKWLVLSSEFFNEQKLKFKIVLKNRHTICICSQFAWRTDAFNVMSNDVCLQLRSDFVCLFFVCLWLLHSNLCGNGTSWSNEINLTGITGWPLAIVLFTNIRILWLSFI